MCETIVEGIGFDFYTKMRRYNELTSSSSSSAAASSCTHFTDMHTYYTAVLQRQMDNYFIKKETDFVFPIYFMAYKTVCLCLCVEGKEILHGYYNILDFILHNL